MIVVVDYGMGNLRSVAKALTKVGAKVKVSAQPADIRKAKKIVLPGVGAFGDAVQELKKRGLFYPTIKEVKNGKPFLGICLGMQLLFEKSSENPRVKGLCLVKGSVKRFSKKVKIPQIGWNQVRVRKGSPLFKGITNNSYMYFCHSYYVVPKDKKVVAAKTHYNVYFTSVIHNKNIFGVQFHPEKSQELGLKVLRNFVKL